MNLTRKLASQLTYANVVATLALFIALGGVSYAAVKIPRNSIGTAQIKKGAVTDAKINKKTLQSLRGVSGPAGPEGPQGQMGLRGPSDVYFTMANMVGAQTSVPGSSLTVKTMNLPAGKYLILNQVDIKNSDDEVTTVDQEIQCGLWIDGQPPSGWDSAVFEGQPHGETAVPGSRGSLEWSSIVGFAEPTQVKVSCNVSSPSSPVQQTPFSAYANLKAVQVERFIGQ